MNNIELKAMQDYKNALGNIVLVSVVQGIDSNENSIEITLDKPMQFRVTQTSDESILRWMGTDLIDSVWDVEPLSYLKELEGVSALSCYANTYHTDGKIEQGDVSLPK
ncbi:hypothetical protein VCHA53O466_320017 [Vibrio chagasii]|nr:hypothetical protein VCHA53O466_320017 [Vibrio chagasii]